MKRYFLPGILLLGFLLLSGNSIFASSLIYREIIGESEKTKEIIITPTDNGYTINTKDSLGNVMVYKTDAQYAVLSWEYKNAGEGTDILVERAKNTLSITGTLKKEKFEKKQDISALPLYEEWGLSLESFAVSSEKTMIFWSISLENLNIAKFKATKEEVKTIKVNGKDVETVRIKIAMQGFAGIFWSADFWFRTSDGREVYEKVPGKPSDPVALRELITENK